MPLPTLPSPHTWAANNLVWAPWLRQDVSDAVALLSLRPTFVGQQQTAAQQPASGSVVPVQLDTEILDSWNGHQVNSSSTNPNYYPNLAGFYLCEASAPLTASVNGGRMSSLIGGVQSGGALADYGGGNVQNSSTFTQATAVAKIMQMVNVGTFGSGDYIRSSFFQNSGTSTIPLVNSATAYPYMSARWVSALSGTIPAAEPSNPAWPTPPTVLTSTFLNTNVRDVINFLIYPPVFEAQRSGAGNLASQAAYPTVGTQVALGLVNVDTWSGFSVSTNNYTIPVAGLYYVYGCMAISSGANADCAAAGITVTSANYNGGTQITLWGGATSSVASSTASAVVRKRLRFNAGDVVQLAAIQHDTTSAAAAYTTSGSWLSRLIIVWEGL